VKNKNYRIISIFEFCAIALLLVIMASMLSSLHYFAELLSHFQFQYFWIAILLFVVFALLRRKKACVISFISLLLAASQVMPLYFDWAEPHTKTGSKKAIKMMLSNVYSGNRNHNKLIEFVKDEQPDILVLQEVNKRWVDKLTVLFELYPYRLIEPRSDNFGIAVFSKIDTVKQELVYLGGVKLPSIESTFSVNDKIFSLITTHPVPPISQDYYQFRNTQLATVAKRMSKIDTAKVLIGDLNITTWSSDYQLLELNTGLRNARHGFGVLPTWPVNLSPLMIPIDHILVSQEFSVKNLFTGPDVGSDHLPLVVEVEW